MRSFGLGLPRTGSLERASPGTTKPVVRNTARPDSARRPFLALLRRREPSTYQRCLAVHIHFAGPRSALS